MITKNSGQYGAMVIGIILLILSVKIIYQDDDFTTKDTIAVIIGFGIGIPIVLGSIFILRKENNMKNTKQYEY